MDRRPGPTDFRADLPKIDVPMLVIQGDDDRVLPYPKTGERLPGLISDMQMVVIEGGPHAIAWTHTDQINAALQKFMAWPRATRHQPGPRGSRPHSGPIAA